MNKYVKLTLKTIGIIFLTLLILLGAYVIYFVSSYYRIEDKVELEVENPVEAIDEPITERVQVNTPYTVTSYNIGFGAYSDDFSFFMDGGTDSVAFSEEEVLKNINGSISIIEKEKPDFALFQEVDLDSTRSYHVNEYNMIREAFPEMNSTFAINFDSPYIFFPFTQPHGKAYSGIATLSDFYATGGVRRSLPIDENLNKYVDLDRCFSYTEYPIDEEKSLFLYNVHLSAYSLDPSTVQNQVKMLSENIAEKYEAGNYVVIGGDFNQDVLGNSSEVFHTEGQDYTWARAFDKSLLPNGFSFVSPDADKPIAPTCRLADAPYIKGESFVIAIDGFIVSDNVKALSLEHMDADFLYSDHNPVKLTFELD